MQQKIWQVKEPVSEDLLNQFPELPPLLVQLLANRNLTSAPEVEAFLNPDYEKGTHDPFLFKDMNKAVERLFSAIEKHEKIIIHGDYDSDGVNGSAVLMTILKDLGGNPEVFLPHREKDGYGVNIKTVEYLKKTYDMKVMITVDCGSTNHEPMARAKELGVDVIITDHHHAPDIFPDVLAVLNPMNMKDNYPFKYLCGTAVAFKLAQAMFITDQKSASPKLAPGYDKWFLDLVAIATVTDMMPLLDENRVLLKYGLIVLNKTRRPGLKKLFEVAGIWNYAASAKPVDPFDIGFVIGPRINAAGRMDHANSALFCLMAESEESAQEFVDNIEMNNRDRKVLVEKIMGEVMAQAEGIDDKQILVAIGDGWPMGVAGLIASKALEKLGKPVVIMTHLEDRIAASGRSVPGFHMVEALEKLKDYFSTFGGHAMACGFSLKDGVDPQFIKKELERLAEEALAGKDLRPSISIDAELPAEKIRWDVVDQANLLQPLGMANPQPLFLTTNLEVIEVRKLGSDEQHLKLKLQDRKSMKMLSAIGFSISEKYAGIKIGSTVDIVYRLEVNEWNGNRELQLKIEDLNIL